jgi:hypothetical protein
MARLPPSMGIMAPVIQIDASDARKTASPSRPSASPCPCPWRHPRQGPPCQTSRTLAVSTVRSFICVRRCPGTAEAFSSEMNCVSLYSNCGVGRHGRWAHPPRSGDDLLHHVAVYVREPHVTAAEAERQFFVVQPQQMENGGVKVMHIDHVLDGDHS